MLYRLHTQFATGIGAAHDSYVCAAHSGDATADERSIAARPPGPEYTNITRIGACWVSNTGEVPCQTLCVTLHLPFVGTYQDAALDALGDPTRRAIFERLGRGPCAVGEIAAELPVSRPAVSQHLKVLKHAGLVTDQAVGTRRVYRLDPRGIDALAAYFTHFWSTAMSAFREEVNRQAHAEREGPADEEQS